MKKQLDKNNGYSSKEAFLEIADPFIKRLDKASLKGRVSMKRINRAEKIMLNIKPKIAPKRIKNYSQLTINYYLGGN